MLSKNAMSELTVNSSKKFVTRVYNYLEPYYPAEFEFSGEQPIRNEIALAMQSCHEYQITTEKNVAKFCYLWFHWGRHFDAKPNKKAHKSILVSKELPENQKIKQLYALLKEE